VRRCELVHFSLKKLIALSPRRQQECGPGPKPDSEAPPNFMAFILNRFYQYGVRGLSSAEFWSGRSSENGSTATTSNCSGCSGIYQPNLGCVEDAESSEPSLKKLCFEFRGRVEPDGGASVGWGPHGGRAVFRG
jgi:hypothetical protein